MKYALAHGEQFTRLRIRVSPSEFKKLIDVGLIKRQPGVFRIGKAEPIATRGWLMCVNNRHKYIVKVVNGWYELNLERTTLLSKDRNHQWLKVVLEAVQKVFAPTLLDEIPLTFRQTFADESDVVFRRTSRLVVRGRGKSSRVTYWITRDHQIASEMETSDAPPPELPPASTDKLEALVHHYEH